jgi:hypothetical protein
VPERPRLLRGPDHEQRALGEHEFDVDAGGHLDRGVVNPRAVRIGPALDPVVPQSRPVGGDLADPVVETRIGAHHRANGFPAVGIGQHEARVDGVVTLAEDRRRHRKRLSHNGLCGAGAVVDDRLDVLDGDAADGRLRRR